MVMLTLPRVQVCLAGFLRVCPLECICKFTFVCTYVGLYICRLVGGWVGRPVGVSSVIGCLLLSLLIMRVQFVNAYMPHAHLHCKSACSCPYDV